VSKGALMTRVLFATAVAACAISLTSCQSGSIAASTMGGRPTVLRYCYTSTSEDPGAAVRRIEPFQRYMERTLHVRVDAVRTSGYAGVIEAFRSHKVDLASISPFSYVLASEKADIEALVMRGNAQGEPGEYTGVLAVPGNSPLRSIDDVIAHARDLTISFVDPASTSGFLAQNFYLQSRGIDSQKDFRKMVFSMDHMASLMTLKAGKVDVAACMQRLIDGYLANGKLKPGDVRVLWTSPPMPNQPVAIRKDFPASFKEEIRRAYLEMHLKDPEAFAAQNLRAKAFRLPGVQLPYVAASDVMFDGLRQMARGVKNLSLLEH